MAHLRIAILTLFSLRNFQFIAILAICLISGCFDDDSRWHIPSEIAAAVSSTVQYDPPPAWEDGAHCAGGLRPGTEALAAMLQQQFAQIESVNGYDCRSNTANPDEMSEHGTGRAIDLVISTQSDQADSALGDPVANWLVEHSAELGVQLIIWNRSIWIGDSLPPEARHYDGPDPHVDHIHVELNEAAAG